MVAKTTKTLRGKKETAATRYWKQYSQLGFTSSRLWLEGFNVSTRFERHKKVSHFSHPFQIDSSLWSSLEKFTKKNRMAMESLLQSAFGILLNRYAGSDSVLFGVATLEKQTKQNLTVADSIIPIRSDIHENESILQHLKKMHKQIQQNQKYSSGLLEENPFFEKMNFLFVHHAAHSKKKKTVINLEQFHLVILTHPKNKIEFFYSENILTAKSVENIAEHFVVILEKIIQEYDQSVMHFSILTTEEKQKILNEWSKPIHISSTISDEDCIQDLFSIYAKSKPESLAVSYLNIDMNYGDLDSLSNQLAHVLLEKNVKPGDTVAVLMERTPAIIVAMLGIFKIGAIYVPINPKYPDERIQFILSDCQANLILANDSERIGKEFKSKLVKLDDEYELLKLANKKKIPFKISSEQIAYVIYTSGTTGQPKGVMIKHSSLANLCVWYQSYFHVDEKDRASQFASQGFDTFFCETIPYLALGASIHIIDDHAKLTPSLFLPWLAKQKITIADLPTAYAQILFSMTWPKDINLRLLKVGGESVSRYPTQMFSFDIWNGYGPTEAAIESTFIKFFEANVPPNKQSCKHTPPPIGKPIANTEVYVVDSHLELVPVGNIGELLIGGKNLSAGYLNRAQLTREKFIRNIFSDDPNSKLYRTGDLVRWLEDGNLEFIGRVDHQIKIRGYRIELSEIETTINQFSDVQEVVVLAKELINGQKTLIAYLLPDLEKLRIPYQERCLLEIDDSRFLDLITEDISKDGLAISGVYEELQVGMKLRVNLKLPGMSDAQWLSAKLVWQLDQRVGLQFDSTSTQKALLQKSIEYFLSSHNLMQTLQSASAKRSLRKALKKKLPDYMIPSVFTILSEFPLTFNGKVDVNALPPPQDFDRLLERKFVAPRSEIEKEIAHIWSEILAQPQVSITDNFFDLGGNSLLVSLLSVKIMQRFNMSIPAKILFDLPFIPILAEFIESKGKHYTARSSIQDEILHDSILHENLSPLHEGNTFYRNPRGVLLTGAGGFLGLYLLRELLKKTDAKIYCLIRKGTFESAAKRLMVNVDRYELGNEITLANRRIVIIASDIGLDRFGMPAEQYDNLAGKVDTIYHCGAQVNTMASYTTLRNSNVQGTIEIIKFATQQINKSIHYISTLSAAYKTDSRGKFIEDFPDADPGELVGGYALSKWVSERLLAQIKNRGLPVSIYRSGYILGQSDTGITNLNDALLLLIKGCIQLGFAPNWKERITLLPVDFVSEAVIGISLFDPEKGGVFHLDHPKGMMWTDFVSWLNDFGYKIKLCSHHEWLQHLTKIDQDNALFPFLPHYLAQTNEPKTPETGMIHAERVLEKINLAYPEIDDSLLHRYMNYFCSVGFFPTPQNRKRSFVDVPENLK